MNKNKSDLRTKQFFKKLYAFLVKHECIYLGSNEFYARMELRFDNNVYDIDYNHYASPPKLRYRIIGAGFTELKDKKNSWDK